MEEGGGPKVALKRAHTLLGNDVRAACYAMPRGGFIRQYAGMAGATGAGALGAAVASRAAARGKPAANDLAIPKGLLVVLTSQGLVLFSVKAPRFGFGSRTFSEWMRVPPGSYTATQESGRVLERFTLTLADGRVLTLESKRAGASRDNPRAIQAIVAAQGVAPVDDHEA